MMLLGARTLAVATLLAAATLLAGGVAALASAPTTTVVTANVAGPSATFSEVSTSADCAGRLVSGGGTRLAQSTPTVLHNGIRLYASAPTPDGASASASGDAGPTRWLSAGGSGGAVPSDAQTIGYGLCLDAGPTATQVVVASVPGPGGTFATVRAIATCPAGSRLLSGGARTTPGTVGSLKPNGSFPSDADGRPLLTGTDPQSWTAVGLNGGGGDQTNATHAFAICATAGDLPRVTMSHAQVAEPQQASSAAQVSASCPAGTALLGGGGFISDAFEIPGSQGDHLTGSYPSDARGTAVGSGVPASWTAASHTGGSPTGSLTQTDVWALCASDAAAPPPAAMGGGGDGSQAPGQLASKQPPAIAGTRKVGRLLSARRGTWTGAPTSYAYAWLRCTSSGSGCATIGGATGDRYRLKLADAGARMRVRVTAHGTSGATASGVSGATAAVQTGRVTTARLRLDLGRQLTPRGRSAQAGPLLERGVSVLPFRGLVDGRVSISWYRPAHGGTPALLVAQGRRAFDGPMLTTIAVRLSAAGREVVRGSRRLRLTARATLTRRGAATVRASRPIVIAP
jgi:hypothetical protein